MTRAGTLLLFGGLASAALTGWYAGGRDPESGAQTGRAPAARVSGLTSPQPEHTTLEELAAGIEGCEEEEPCLHLAYVWSPSMPLSRAGIREVARAADDVAIGLRVLAARELEQARDAPGVESLRTSLVVAGATVHYPSLVVLDGEAVVGGALAGYKRADAYASLVRDRLAAVTREEVRAPAPLGPASGTEAGGEGGVDASSRPTSTGPEQSSPEPTGPGGPGDIEVVWTYTLSPSPGAFFRRVPGTSFIAYDQRNAVHLRDLESDSAFRGPGYIDFVPTPDGALFVTPARGSGGLEFYLAQDVFEAGTSGGAEGVEPFFVDRELTDEYPSVGILARDAQGRAVRYRVLVSWFSGVAFRDYEVAWGEDGPTALEPVTPEREGCPGLVLSTPILSKDGRELAARHEATGTTKLFRMEDGGTCRELFDFGHQTSKVGFSDDGNLIAYSSPDPAHEGSGARSTTYVLHRPAMHTTEVPHSASVGLVIPEVIGPDSLLIAVREAGSSSSEFRLLCCVR